MNDHPIDAPAPNGSENWLAPYMPDGPMVPYEPPQKLVNAEVIRGILFRQRWLIAGVIIAAITVGLVMTLLATPMYEARAKVSIEPYSSTIMQGQDIEQVLPSNQVEDFLLTKVEFIKSSSLARVVVEENNLGERADLLGADVDSSRPPNMSDEKWLESKKQMATSIIAGSVIAELQPNKWIIQIGYRSDRPALAAEIANGYTEAFAASSTRNSSESNTYALNYLTEQIEATRTQLEAAEQQANAYARNSGIIFQQRSVESGGEVFSEGGTLTTANLASINQRVAEARAARIAAEQRWRSIQNAPATQLPEVQNNPVLQSLVSERTAKQTELIELRQRYDDDFPQIANLLAQIQVLEGQIERSGADIKAAVRNEFVVARNQEQALESELNALTGETLNEQDQQVQLSVLEREAQALRDQLTALLNRYNQINSAGKINEGGITLLDAAVVPGAPYSPNLMKNLLLATVFGVAMAAGLAVLREALDDKIRSLDEIEARMGLSLLGHTPHIEQNDFTEEAGDQLRALMEAYSYIRAAIDFSLPRNSSVIHFTSSQASEGKSTTAVILAELFAGVDRKTLLIDADLRKPSVAKILGLDRVEHGITEVLLGEASMNEALVRGMHDNLDILPVASLPQNPTVLLSSSRMIDFLNQCRSEYDVVIIDSAPVLGLADAPVLSRLCDATVFVLEANRVPFGQARTAAQRIKAAGGNVLGVVLTKYRALQAGQSYDDQYSYYQYSSDPKS